MATAPAAVSANKAELLAVADAVAREKLIDKGIVIEAMEDAIQRAARARYGAENDIRAKLDPISGDIVGIDGDTVTIATPKGERSFPFANIASAKLLLTDKLINATAPLSTDGAETIETVEE